MEGKMNITSAKYVAHEIKGSGHTAIKAVIESIKNYEGKPDTFGKILRVTAIAIVDELCSAAELVMQKTNNCPMAIIKNYKYIPKDDRISSLIRPESEDLFK